MQLGLGGIAACALIALAASIPKAQREPPIPDDFNPLGYLSISLRELEFYLWT